MYRYRRSRVFIQVLWLQAPSVILFLADIPFYSNSFTPVIARHRKTVGAVLDANRSITVPINTCRVMIYFILIYIEKLGFQHNLDQFTSKLFDIKSDV